MPSYVYKGLGFFDADEIKDVSALLGSSRNRRPTCEPRLSFDRGSSGCPTRRSSSSPRGCRPRSSITTAAARCARRRRSRDARLLPGGHISRWLSLVDLIPPAELFELVLAESAYAFELAGLAARAGAREPEEDAQSRPPHSEPRLRDALGRFADYLDALTAGDEPNAVVDALDAVNLMTVHAAKGLEFPIVFVVNLAKGSGGPRQPIRVSAAGEDEPASVSIGAFDSETDDDERSRELEESKRLLYVALTRARDRLYVASTLRGGLMRPGRGSLGEVLPSSALWLFERAAGAAEDTIAWGDRPFVLRVCRPRAADEPRPANQAIDRWQPPSITRGADDFDPA